MSPKAKIANRVAGWGRALPIRSIAVRNRERMELRGIDVPFLLIGCETSGVVLDREGDLRESTWDSRADPESILQT